MPKHVPEIKSQPKHVPEIKSQPKHVPEIKSQPFHLGPKHDLKKISPEPLTNLDILRMINFCRNGSPESIRHHYPGSEIKISDGPPTKDSSEVILVQVALQTCTVDMFLYIYTRVPPAHRRLALAEFKGPIPDLDLRSYVQTHLIPLESI
jgi:hypothetical protein